MRFLQSGLSYGSRGSLLVIEAYCSGKISAEHKGGQLSGLFFLSSGLPAIRQIPLVSPTMCFMLSPFSPSPTVGVRQQFSCSVVFYGLNNPSPKITVKHTFSCCHVVCFASVLRTVSVLTVLVLGSGA